MKTKFKTLTIEPEYNILKNINFRNNQNYILTNNKLNGFSKSFDLYEKKITLTLYGIYLFILVLGMLGSMFFNNLKYYNLMLMFFIIFALPAFSFISNFKQYFILNRRKKVYIPIKIFINKSYYLILYKIGGNIVKNFYE